MQGACRAIIRTKKPHEKKEKTMRKRPALLVVVHCALLGTAFASLAGEDKTAVDDAVARGREIARIDGTVIRLHELSYDPEQRYNVELHAMEVRLYRSRWRSSGSTLTTSFWNRRRRKET